jgi:hypothetical protein
MQRREDQTGSQGKGWRGLRRKVIHQAVMDLALVTLAVGTLAVAYHLSRLVQLIEWIRSDIPISSLGL